MDNRSFEDLVERSAPGPDGGDRQPSWDARTNRAGAGQVCLDLQGGSSVTLDTASVKSHAVLGSSVGHTIVRIDIDPAKIPEGTVFKGPLEGRLKTRGSLDEMAKGSFDDLVNEAPSSSPAPGTVSLVGTSARSTEPGKFVLTLQGGSSVTLDNDIRRKGHVVLGSSKEHMIIRIDVDLKKIPAGTVLGGSIRPSFGATRTNGDQIGPPVAYGGPVQASFFIIPFALVTWRQVPAPTLAAIQGLLQDVTHDW